MFRSLGLVFCVVVMAAFVFGCGGGGGGTAHMPDPDPPPVVDPDQPPEPTDAERIAEAQQTIAGILTTARARATAASSAASAIGTNPDALPSQITSASSSNTAAQVALSRIIDANTAAIAATTPAAAQAALTAARTAQGALNTAVSAITSIQSAVQAVTNARRQREADERALTNNSSLIQHLRDNTLLADAVLGAAGANLTAASIVVGPVGDTTRTEADTETCVAPCAIFPGDTGTGANRVTGQRTVSVTPTGGTALTSDSTTPALSGTGRLPHGFDLRNAAGTTFVNAYTNITKTRLNERTRTAVVNDDPGTPQDERFVNMDVADTDYLLAGIWMIVDNAALGNSRITAFAYGSQPIPAAATNFCVGIEASGATAGEPTRNCATTDGLNSISSFVDDGRDFTATYRGNANGAYLAGSDSSYFTGDVTLTAEFQNPTGAGADGSGSIEGAVTNIVAGGQSMAGSIELQQHTFGNAIEAEFGDDAIGVVDDKAFNGEWKGQFFGTRVTRSSQTTPAADGNPAEITTTYSAEAPGSVAGTFYATQQSNPAGSAAFIGAFGAHR